MSLTRKLVRTHNHLVDRIFAQSFGHLIVTIRITHIVLASPNVVSLFTKLPLSWPVQTWFLYRLVNSISTRSTVQASDRNYI
jgi:hypothetical protein